MPELTSKEWIMNIVWLTLGIIGCLLHYRNNEHVSLLSFFSILLGPFNFIYELINIASNVWIK